MSMSVWCCGLTAELLYGDEYQCERDALKQQDPLLMRAHLDVKYARGTLRGDAVYSTYGGQDHVVWRTSSGLMMCSYRRNARGSTVESQIGYLTRGDRLARGTIEVRPGAVSHLRDLFRHCSDRRFVVKLQFVGTTILTDRVDIKPGAATSGWHYGVTRDQLLRALFSDEEIANAMRDVVLRFAVRNDACVFAQLANSALHTARLDIQPSCPMSGIHRCTGRVNVFNYDECLVSVSGLARDVDGVVRNALQHYAVAVYNAPEDRVFVAPWDTVTIRTELRRPTCELARVGEHTFARVEWHPTASYRWPYARSVVQRRCLEMHREHTPSWIHASLMTDPDVCRHGSERVLEQVVSTVATLQTLNLNPVESLK